MSKKFTIIGRFTTGDTIKIAVDPDMKVFQLKYSISQACNLKEAELYKIFYETTEMENNQYLSHYYLEDSDVFHIITY